MSPAAQPSAGDSGDAELRPEGVTGALASRLRTVATMVTLPHHDQILGGLLLLVPLVVAFRTGGSVPGLIATAGLSAYLGCVQLAYGGVGTLRRPLRAGTAAGWPDLVLVPAGIAGLGVYLVTAARCLSSLLE